MPSNLRIAVFRGCTFFKIHCLEDGVLSILLFDCKRGGLYLPLTLQSGIFGFLFLLFGGIVGKEVALGSFVFFFWFFFFCYIVADQGVVTFILGAFVCCVFGQYTQQVAELMVEIFGVASIENIVYAVPGHEKSAMVFEKHFSVK